MQNSHWLELFQTIPESQHNTLVLTTLSGVELSIETVLRLDDSVLIFRGRVCGQTDDGRIFFLPYRQIDFLQINRAVREEEFHELYRPGEAPALRSACAAPPASSPSFHATMPQKSGLIVAANPESSPQVVPMTPQVPPAALRPGAPAHPLSPSRHGISSQSVSPTVPNIPAAALVPPPSQANAVGPAPARNSILERLRAQRNAVLPPRSPTR